MTTALQRFAKLFFGFVLAAAAFVGQCQGEVEKGMQNYAKIVAAES